MNVNADHECVNMHRIGQLEHRVAALETEREVREVLAEYCAMADRFKWAAWQNILTRDVVFIGPFGEVTGSDAVVEASVAATGSNDETQHLISNISVAVLGQADVHASAELIYVGVPEKSAPGQYLTLGGRYSFSFRRDPDRWRISRVHLRSLYRREPHAVV